MNTAIKEGWEMSPNSPTARPVKCRLSTIANSLDALGRRVNLEIHPNDGMFVDNTKHYYWCGEDAIKKICGVLSLAGSNTPSSILDLACGYGRVARWLTAAFPDSRIVVSDIDKTAVEFCASEFDVEPHISNGAFSNSDLPGKFDLIWSGSLMTHLDRASASHMLVLLSEQLREGGVAIFTVHGRYVANRVDTGNWPYNLTEAAFRAIADDYQKGAYAYTDYEGVDGYGISLTPMPWIFSRLSEDKTIRLAAFLERGWAEHQDLIAFIKVPI